VDEDDGDDIGYHDDGNREAVVHGGVDEYEAHGDVPLEHEDP